MECAPNSLFVPHDEESGALTPPKSFPTSRTSGITASLDKIPLETTQETFYDGGLEGWSSVFGAWFALFGTFGWLNSLGLFQTYYEQTLLSSYSASAISWIFTVQLFLMWAGAAIFGRIIDTYGTHPVAIPCAIVCTFSTTTLSFSTQYYQIFLSQGVGFGIAASGLFCCATTSTGQWFHKRKALALGIVLAGSSTGGVIHSLCLHILISKVGFPAAVRWSALIIGISGTIACIFMRSRLPKKQWDHRQQFVDLSFFKDGTFAVYCIGTFLVVWGLFAPWDYLPSMSLRHNFSQDEAVYTIVVLNGTSILGRIIPAYLGDRFGRFNCVTLVAFLNSTLLLAFWLPIELTRSSHTHTFAFSACYGFASGAFISLMMPSAAELGPVETTGQRFGTYQMVVGIASLTSLPIQGSLIPQAHGGFANLIKFSGVSVMLGSVFIFGARMLQVKEIQKA